jgi:ABC-2 type transport system permease protein
VRLRRQIIKNDLTRLTREKVIRFSLLLLIGVMFFVLDYLFFYRIISYIARIDVLDMVEVGTILVARLLSMIFLMFFSMLLFSNIVTSLSTLYLSSDLALLLSSPIRFSSIFMTKFFETTLNSSSLLLIFGLPVFIVCGQEYHASWVYYCALPFVLLPFTIIPATLGTMVTMILVRFFPVKRVRQVLAVFGLILGAGLVVVFRFLRPEQLVSEIGMNQLLSYIRQNRIPSPSYLPSTWAAEALMALLEDHTLKASLHLLWLFLVAGGIYALALHLAKIIYYTGWTGTSESRTVKMMSRGRLSEKFLLRLPFLHPTTKSLLIKDIKLFWRDTTQWSQLLMLAALLLIYFFNIKSLPLRNIYLKNLISFLNLGLAGFVLASLGARFVYPSTSLEGSSFWVIHAAPIQYRRFLLEKFFVFLVPLLILAETLIVISNILLGVNGYMMMLSVVTIFLITIGLTGLGVGMGAIYPKFINENPAQIAMSIGGILYMIFSLVYIGVTIVLEAWPVYLYFSQQLFRQAGGAGGISLYLSYLCVAILSTCVTLFPLYLGIKRLQSFEIV